MILIDHLDWAENGEFQTRVTPLPTSCLATESGIPNWAGLEYMAQSVAAYSGNMALSHSGKVKEGFLLGTREVIFHCEAYPFYEELRIQGKVVVNSNEMGVFDCNILNPSNDVLANCKLNVFQPEDPRTFLNEASA
jgi:predicted hotdog family 3-hydroxylacyl-ACP dehydratase